MFRKLRFWLAGRLSYLAYNILPRKDRENLRTIWRAKLGDFTKAVDRMEAYTDLSADQVRPVGCPASGDCSALELLRYQNAIIDRQREADALKIDLLKRVYNLVSLYGADSEDRINRARQLLRAAINEHQHFKRERQT